MNILHNLVSVFISILLPGFDSRILYERGRRSLEVPSYRKVSKLRTLSLVTVEVACVTTFEAMSMITFEAITMITFEAMTMTTFQANATTFESMTNANF